MEAIMTLMKYSLDMSNPWVTQYYEQADEDNNTQTFGDNRDINRLWITMSDNEMLKLFSKNGKYNFEKQWG